MWNGEQENKARMLASCSSPSLSVDIHYICTYTSCIYTYSFLRQFFMLILITLTPYCKWARCPRWVKTFKLQLSSLVSPSVHTHTHTHTHTHAHTFVFPSIPLPKFLIVIPLPPSSSLPPSPPSLPPLPPSVPPSFLFSFPFLLMFPHSLLSFFSVVSCPSWFGCRESSLLFWVQFPCSVQLHTGYLQTGLLQSWEQVWHTLWCCLDHLSSFDIAY